MMTAERTDGTTDLVVEGEIIIIWTWPRFNHVFLISGGRGGSGGYRGGRGGPRGGGGQQNGYRE